MGILDDAVGGLISQQGGIGGIAKLFQNSGLGDVFSSWISTGKNLPISGEQIQQVLGSKQLRDLAGKTGLSTDDLSSKLAEYLPQVIDKLTPNGKIPEGDILSKGLDLLKGKLFG